MTDRWNELLARALTDRGWALLEQRPMYPRSPNPTYLSIRRGRVGARLLVYGWRITDEGKGRKKKGRVDRDYRIQTTIAGKRPIRLVSGYTPVGLGWDEERQVFASFDIWVKRFANWSDSVHFTRALLDEAAIEGSALEERQDGPEFAFVPARIDGLFGWLARLAERRTVSVTPESQTVSGETLTLVVANPKHTYATWARPGDYLILRDQDGALLDRHVWRVADEPSAEWREMDANKRRLQRLTFEAVRHGIIRDSSWVEAM